MLLDYIIVGNGIAGSCLALNFLKHNKSFLVINTSDIISATSISSGLYNPLVLKRFTLVWRAHEHLSELNNTYTLFEKLLDEKYLFPQKTYKVFSSENDVSAWNKKALVESLKEFILFSDSPLEKDISTNYPLGEVLQGGKINTKKLTVDFTNFLKLKGFYKEDRFDYNLLELDNNTELVNYKGFTAKKIIFCEGFGVKKNPFFNYLPIEGNKGEALIVKLNNPILDVIYKSKVSISHFEDQLNYIGTSFNWEDKDSQITKKALNLLIENLTAFYNNSFKVIKQIAGIRPTVSDRRPILGEHPTDKRLVVFNGLGTRGVMNAPLMAKELYEFLEEKKPLDNEISISRFNSKFAKKI